MSKYLEVAKGKSLEDGTYIYTCGKCGGGSATCDWCYGGDFIKVRDALKQGRRGQTYYSLLKEFLRIAGKAMVSEFAALPKHTPVSVGYIALRFGLNYKATWEWLSECYQCKPYRDPKEYGWKVADVYEAVRKEFTVVEWLPESEATDDK